MACVVGGCLEHNRFICSRSGFDVMLSGGGDGGEGFVRPGTESTPLVRHRPPDDGAGIRHCAETDGAW